MTARIVTVSPAAEREERLAPAVDALRDGALVALPTETFYGLAADSRNRDALAAINRLKGKPPESPILLLASGVEQVREVAGPLPEVFDTLAGTFWPGPLTLVLPARPGTDPDVSGGRATVGIRVPGLRLPRRLAALVGRPIAGVSANETGRPPARTAAEVVEVFGERVAVVLDSGPTAGGAASTVLDLSTERPTIVRAGTLPPQALKPFLPDLVERAPTP